MQQAQIIKYGLIGVGALVVYNQLNKVIDFTGLRKQQSSTITETVNINNQAKQTVENTLGVSKARQDALSTLVSAIYKALHGSWWSEDEDAVIGAINSLNNIQEAEVVGVFYKAAYNVTLGSEIDRYLWDYQKKKIKPDYLTKMY